MKSSQKRLLGLRLPTDPRWVNVVEKNIAEILTDHAWCEQKAASNAISTIVRFPEYPELVEELTAIAIEEMEHFQQVLEKIKARGFKLGFERSDEYVIALSKFFSKGGSRLTQLIDRLLFAAMVEARSCERFRILSEEIGDEDLRQFYHELMVSEAGHYATFLQHARKLGVGLDVETKWNAFLDYEAKIMKGFGKKETMHG
jgi:tRNA 2-(methylsulfanyl)-N6-isopentenyladenosine37 hydroxylase